MKKEKYLEDLHAIQDMTGKIRTINEAIQFGDDFDENKFQSEMGEETEEPQEPMPQKPEPDECADGQCDLAKMKGEEPSEEDGLRELGEVDTIREIALKGMIKLCKNPEDERYQALKKIFQFCDKAAETKDKENM